MRLHILQHVPFEGPGSILSWAHTNHHEVKFTRFYKNQKLPYPTDFDLLVIMGGPMSIYDEKSYPWLKQEKSFLQRCLIEKKKILGICLGAQLLANCLETKVFPNKEKEIGWFPIHKHQDIHNPVFHLYPEKYLPAFHWHSDTFDLPAGAVRLFSSEATLNQGFAIENRIFGLQFHWEVRYENVRTLLQHSKKDIRPGKYIQKPELMMKDSNPFELAQKNLWRLLDLIIESEKNIR